MEEYDVPIYGMKEGVYEYGFTTGTGFFEYFGNPDITTGSLDIQLKVIRRSQFLEFHFELLGTLRVVCDRCLEEFDYPVETSELLYLRFGEDYEEVDDEGAGNSQRRIEVQHSAACLRICDAQPSVAENSSGRQM
jgi:uncharacterized protein